MGIEEKAELSGAERCWGGGEAVYCLLIWHKTTVDVWQTQPTPVCSDVSGSRIVTAEHYRWALGNREWVIQDGKMFLSLLSACFRE